VKRKPLLAAGAVLVVASGLAAHAVAQNGALDPTMQVLDDVRDAERVVDSIEEERPTAGERPTARDRQAPPPAEERRAAPRGEQGREPLELEADVDRDEEGESELEDYDLPEDVDLDSLDEE
jgi:hypothetical protein